MFSRTFPTLRHWLLIAATTGGLILAPGGARIGHAGVALPGAIASLSDCTTGGNTLSANDDGSTGSITLPFSVNYFGTTYSSLFVNNNGNVTFNSSLATFTPFDLSTTDVPIIAPFFADVDTRGAGSGLVRYGDATFSGRDAFCVNWVDVGYYSAQTNKLNSFQLLLVERSDTGTGNFDIYFNYDKIQWETGSASGGSNGLGGSSARAGYSNGVNCDTSEGAPNTARRTRSTGVEGKRDIPSFQPPAGSGTGTARSSGQAAAVQCSFFEIGGSAVNGAFLDSNQTTGLIHNSRESDQDGRYVFPVRGGLPPLPNDNFSDRAQVTGSLPLTLNATNAEATVEVGEPLLLGGVSSQSARNRAAANAASTVCSSGDSIDHTLWYEFTPGSNMTLNIGVSSEDADPALQVFKKSGEGSPSLSNLEVVACSDDVGSVAISNANRSSRTVRQAAASSDDAQATFTAVGGTTYFFQVGTQNNDTGNLSINLSQVLGPDLKLTKSGSPGSVIAGNNITYTLVATNQGPGPATGVKITDALPSGLSFVSSSDCTHSSGTVTCNLGDMAASGASSSKTVTFKAKPRQAGEFENTATIEPAATETDLNPLDNLATAINTVTAFGAQAWGRNEESQLGANSAGGCSGIDCSLVPLNVSGLSDNVIAYAAGGGHSVALRSNGTVMAWGRGESGQIGNNSTAPKVPSPVKVKGEGCGGDLQDVVAIAAGGNRTFASTDDGKLFVWGKNQNGLLGLGDSNNRLCPTELTFETPTATSTSRSAPSSASSSKSGSGNSGDKDNQSEKAKSTSTKPARESTAAVVPVSTSTEVVEIAAGGFHNVVRMKDGTIWSWGSNSDGQLCNGTKTSSSKPVKVPNITGAKGIAAGSRHTLIITSDNKVVACGKGGSGELGYGGTKSKSSPTEVIGLTGVAAISAGDSFSIALLSTGGVRAWGKNTSGQVGDGSSNSRRTSPVTVQGLSNVSDVSAGVAHGLALKSNGEVWAWGFNGNGQLGDGTRTTRRAPVQVSGADDATLISAGAFHSLSLVPGDGASPLSRGARHKPKR